MFKYEEAGYSLLPLSPSPPPPTLSLYDRERVCSIQHSVSVIPLFFSVWVHISSSCHVYVCLSRLM